MFPIGGDTQWWYCSAWFRMVLFFCRRKFTGLHRMWWNRVWSFPGFINHNFRIIEVRIYLRHFSFPRVHEFQDRGDEKLESASQILYREWCFAWKVHISFNDERCKLVVTKRSLLKQEFDQIFRAALMRGVFRQFESCRKQSGPSSFQTKLAPCAKKVSRTFVYPHSFVAPYIWCAIWKFGPLLARSRSSSKYAISSYSRTSKSFFSPEASRKQHGSLYNGTSSPLPCPCWLIVRFHLCNMTAWQDFVGQRVNPYQRWQYRRHTATFSRVPPDFYTE